MTNLTDKVYYVSRIHIHGPASQTEGYSSYTFTEMNRDLAEKKLELFLKVRNEKNLLDRIFSNKTDINELKAYQLAYKSRVEYLINEFNAISGKDKVYMMQNEKCKLGDILDEIPDYAFKPDQKSRGMFD